LAIENASLYQEAQRELNERRRVEEALRENEERFRTLVQNVPVMIDAVDAQGNFVLWNRESERITGYSADGIIGNPRAMELLYPDPERLEQVTQELADHDGDFRDVEWDVRCKDGGFRTLLWTNISNEVPIPGFAQWAVGVDITERKRALEALKEAEERYRRLVEHQGEGIGIVDARECFTFANPAAHDIFGVEEGSLVGKSLRAFLDERAFQSIRAQTEARKAGERSTYETVITRPDRQERVLLVTATPQYDDDGRVIGSLGVFRDITERKLAEQRERDAVARLQLAMESADQGVWEWDFETGLATFDDVALRMLGYEPGFPQKPGDWWMRQIHPDDRASIDEAFAAYLAGDLAKYSVEFRIRRRDGDYVWVASDARVMRSDEEGRPLLVVGIHRDITKRKQADEALEAYSERLKEMVEERTRELLEVREKLLRREKLAMLGQFAGSINHDLRGPLGSISNAAYFLSMALEEPDQDVQKTLDTLQQEVSRAEAIINGMLGLLRTGEPERQVVDVNRLLGGLLSRADIPADVAVTVRNDESMPAVLVDPGQLVQVCHNLVRNAIQAMPEGGRLTVETAFSERPQGPGPGEQGRMAAPKDGDAHGRTSAPASPGLVPSPGDVQGRRDRPPGRSPSHVIICVSDTGEGIPEKNLERIFEPLFTTRSEGTGLGLALARTLVEAHHGTIEVESEVGEGSMFTVRLPVQRE
jgi:PAS domain S-box-containing protein